MPRGFFNLGDLIGKNGMKQGRGYFMLNSGNLWCTSLSRCTIMLQQWKPSMSFKEA